MDELRNEVRQLMTKAGTDLSFSVLMERFCETLKTHPEALGSLSGRYRLNTTDTGLSVAFELAANHFRMLDASEKADAVISGSESDLLAMIRRELTPMKAMFTGRLKVEGSIGLLTRFAQIL